MFPAPDASGSQSHPLSGSWSRSRANGDAQLHSRARSPAPSQSSSLSAVLVVMVPAPDASGSRSYLPSDSWSSSWATGDEWLHSRARSPASSQSSSSGVALAVMVPALNTSGSRPVGRLVPCLLAIWCPAHWLSDPWPVGCLMAGSRVVPAPPPRGFWSHSRTVGYLVLRPVTCLGLGRFPWGSGPSCNGSHYHSQPHRPSGSQTSSWSHWPSGSWTHWLSGSRPVPVQSQPQLQWFPVPFSAPSLSGSRIHPQSHRLSGSRTHSRSRRPSFFVPSAIWFPVPYPGRWWCEVALEG